MKSLYGKYIEEREGKQILEYEWGFAAYKIKGPEIFLAEIYIVKDVRRLGKSRIIVDDLEKIGLENKCEILTANIFLKDPNANITMQAAYANGFEIKESDRNVLLIAKELRG